MSSVCVDWCDALSAKIDDAGALSINIEQSGWYTFDVELKFVDVVFSMDGRVLVALATDFSVVLFNCLPPSFIDRFIFQPENEGVQRVRLSEINNQLVVVLADGKSLYFKMPTIGRPLGDEHERALIPITKTESADSPPVGRSIAPREDAIMRVKRLEDREHRLFELQRKLEKPDKSEKRMGLLQKRVDELGNRVSRLICAHNARSMNDSFATASEEEEEKRMDMSKTSDSMTDEEIEDFVSHSLWDRLRVISSALDQHVLVRGTTPL